MMSLLAAFVNGVAPFSLYFYPTQGQLQYRPLPLLAALANVVTAFLSLDPMSTSA